MLTERQKYVLAVFAAAGDDVQFSPAQVQKLFFLLDKKISPSIGGQKFDFQPYDYGPFDRAVYEELDLLSRQGYIQIHQGSTPAGRRYMLTLTGSRQGASALSGYVDRARNYMGEAARWVRSLSFAQLVGSIYNAYPEMKANSIFQG